MSHLRFALAVHHAVTADPREQVCWSPFSVVSALGLLTHGARESSREELLGLLGDLDGVSALVAEAAVLEESHYATEAPVIAVSNTLWADASIEIEESFAAELARWSGGSVRNAPFQAEPEKAREAINADVAQTTRQLIPELLPPGVISKETVSALVNALYLKCGWHCTFNELATQPRPFHAPAGTVDVPTMMLNERIGYAAKDGWQVIGLPATGGVEAVILLPNGDLADAEPALTAQSLAALLEATSWQQVALRMPKLKLTTKAELTEPLKAIGVRAVFDKDAADLRGISPSPLFVEQVLHEAVLEIDERGLEGAAATAAVMAMAAALPPEQVEVTVDRPFLLLVRHARTGAVYFLARVTDPS